jgi:multiple sugar transport system substrate-binding protein
LQAQPLLGQLHDIFEQARPRPVTPFYIMISQVLQSEFSAVIAGVKPADMALQSAQTRVEKILAHGD